MYYFANPILATFSLQVSNTYLKYEQNSNLLFGDIFFSISKQFIHVTVLKLTTLSRCCHVN